MSKAHPLLFFALCCFARCNAGKIDSHDLLIGDWDTTLRCSNSRFGEVFPPRVSAVLSKEEQRRWGTPRNFHCRLSLHPNGTFGLEPSGTATSQLLSVHGRWTLETNPYCVTDRFYDDLILDSYPRVQKKREGDEETVVRKLRLNFKCRLSGHFTGDRLRFQDRDHFARGKMSHGVLILQRDDDESKKPWWYRPRIAGSFSARRLIPSRSALASQLGDDMEVFGY